jgi:cobalt-zinc-cadmium efflux system membrane fusion protein
VDGAGGSYSLRSPIDGVVVSRQASPGQSAAEGDVLVEVADLSTLWAMLDVPEEHAARVRPGQRVVLRFDRNAHSDVAARVTRIAASVDKHTRTVRARVDVPNPDRSLRAGLFLRARIDTGGQRQTLVLPRDAVQRVEGQDLVFVRTGDGVYEPKAVDVLPATDRRVAVLKGLDRGSEVVVAGAFLLKTEILKDSIGAGCADDH